MRYMVRGYKKQTGKIQEGFVHSTYVEAFAESQDLLKSDQYEVIVILADAEGADHPDNAGKFFLRRIVK